MSEEFEVLEKDKDKDMNTGVEEFEVSEPIYKKEEEIKAKKREPKKGKKPAWAFKEAKYYEKETYEHMMKKKKKDKWGRSVRYEVPTGQFMERDAVKESFCQKYGGGSRSNKDALHRAKCCIRAAKSFDVSVDHLEKGYYILSGKKIDGIYATDLIDRLGWSNGQQMSRDQLRIRYRKPNINAVIIAQDKLYDILNTADIAKAYVDFVQDIKDEFSKKIRDKSVYGE